MLNPYTISFITAVVVYVALFSKLNNTEEDGSSNWFHMESAMYSAGAAAIGFAIVYFLNSKNVMINDETTFKGAILNNRPSVNTTATKANATPGSTIGSTGEILMNTTFQ